MLLQHAMAGERVEPLAVVSALPTSPDLHAMPVQPILPDQRATSVPATLQGWHAINVLVTLLDRIAQIVLQIS